MNWLNPFHTAYNVPTTVLLAIAGVIGGLIVWKVVEKFRIKIDKKLVAIVVPWVLLTAAIRVIRDVGVLHLSLFVSPWLYLFMSAIVVLYVWIMYRLNKQKYWKESSLIVFMIFFVSLIFLPFRNLMFLIYFLIFFLPWVFLLYSFFQIGKLSKENLLVLLTQLYDANVTAVSVQYFGYISKHVIPTGIISIGGPYAFVLVKFIAILFVLLLLDGNIKRRNLRNYIKLLIGAFALLTGSRDLLRGCIGI